jgi:hypothetical protein
MILGMSFFFLSADSLGFHFFHYGFINTKNRVSSHQTSFWRLVKGSTAKARCSLCDHGSYCFLKYFLFENILK